MTAIGNCGLGAAIMYGIVSVGRQVLPSDVPDTAALSALVATGVITYSAYCIAFSRVGVGELRSLVVRH